MATNQQLIAGLYTAFFNRAPDAQGLNFWEGEFGSGKTVNDLAAGFAGHPVFEETYGELTDQAFVEAIYQNILGAAGDAAGVAAWVGALEDGLSRDQFVAEFVYAALNADLDAALANGDLTQAEYDLAVTRQQTLTNKAEVGIYYAETLGAASNLDPETDVSTKEGLEADPAYLASQQAIAGVSADPATVAAAKAEIDDQAPVDPGVPGQSFALTAGVDTIVGTADNDTITGVIDTATPTNTTLTALDTIDGGAGNDTLSLLSVAGGVALPAGLVVKNVENLSVRSSADATLNTATWAGLENVEISQAVGVANVTAAATTDVSVSGVGGTITVNGGDDITVSDAVANNAITIGATTAAAGNVSVTDTNVGNAAVAVDGGKNVDLTLNGATGNTVTVGNGGAATDLPTGAVKVSSAIAAQAATDASASSITVKGGSTVAVSQSATSAAAAADATGATVTLGAVNIEAGNATTSVTVSQTASTAEATVVPAVAGVTETATVKFTALAATDTAVVGGLTFTAAVAMTAAEVADAFANLANGTLPVAGDSQGAGAASKGVYTGAVAGWNSGTASGDTVVFSSATPGNAVDLTASAGASVVAKTDGALAVAAKAGTLGVINGTVTIDDNATASVTTVTVDGYGDNSLIGNTTALSKLANLSLANSGGTKAGDTDATMTVAAGTASSLNLSLNNVNGAVSFVGTALETLNVTATGANSAFALAAGAVETLTVAGDKAVSFTADLADLKSVTVSGAAGLTLSGAEADTLTSVNTSATTGAVTATIDGTKATYTGGAGVDKVTLTTGTALTKAINLGAGDDTVIFGAAISGSSAALNGGDGTDTLVMNVANADALDNIKQTFYTGFERLVLSDAFGVNDDTQASLTIDLANLGFTNHVTTAGTVADADPTKSDTLVLDKLASNGTVVLTANGLVSVQVAEAATGTADVLNAVLSSAGDLDAGTLTAANVETVNVTSFDTETGPTATTNSNDLVLTADKAATINLSGASNLDLVLTGSTKAALIDGSAMTGALTVSTLTGTATTVKGGAGNDVLTATGSTADVLEGGAGNDTLVSNAGMSTLTGGAGNDLFVVGAASVNVNSYSTITDFGAGDLIKFAGAGAFKAAQVTLGQTAVFQDYANSAVNEIAAGEVAWFQFSGDTYVVMDAGGDSTAFTNGQDFIVKLAGLVDLSNASFNNTHDTISL